MSKRPKYLTGQPARNGIESRRGFFPWAGAGTRSAYAGGLSKATDPTEIKVLTSITKQFRKNCATTALHFGFRLDSTDDMNLEKPMS
jgi:hypothetical protein